MLVLSQALGRLGSRAVQWLVSSERFTAAQIVS